MIRMTFARRWSTRAVVLGAVVGTTRPAGAADETPPPAPAAPVLAAPAVVAPDCPTCHAPAGAPVGPGCATCGHGLLGRGHGSKRVPYTPYINPGACFGYFQTRWHRWEEVCPLPYQGVGVSDAPPPSPGYVPPGQERKADTTPKKPEVKGTDLGAPRPVPMPAPPGTDPRPMPPGSDTRPMPPGSDTRPMPPALPGRDVKPLPLPGVNVPPPSVKPQPVPPPIQIPQAPEAPLK